MKFRAIPWRPISVVSLSLALGCTDGVTSPRLTESPKPNQPDQPSPASPNTIVTGAEADSLLWATARAWASEGNESLMAYLNSHAPWSARARDSVEAAAKEEVARRGLISQTVAAFEEGAPPTVWPSPGTAPSAYIVTHSTQVNINGASGNLAGSVTYVGSHSKVVFTFQAVRTSTGANAVMQQSSEQSSLGPQYWDCAGTPRNAPCNMLGTSTYAVNVGLPVPCDVTLEASGTYRAWFTWLIPLPVPGGWDWGVLTWGETDPEAGPTSQKNSGTCTPPTARVKVETTSSPYSWAGNNGSLVITAVGTSGYVRADATTSTKGSLDIASFKWSVDGTEVSTAAVAPIEVPLGTHSVSLTVTDTDGKTSTASASVTVKKPVRRVSVSLGSPAIAIGSGLYASASAYDEDNNSVPGGCVFSWWSSNGSVAAVDASGFVAGIGAGSATIYAQCEGVTGFAELSVVSCNGGGGGGGGGETYVVGATINPCGVPGGGGGGGGGGWQTVCVEYEVGYYYPDTGERVVLAEWTECYQIAAQLVTSAFGGAPRKKVSLIASGRTSDAAATRVIRRMAGDFIVIDTTRATARDLATSIAALQTLRSSGTPIPENGDMAVGSDLVTASNWESTTGRDLDVTLKVLRLMPIREVEGFGPRRSTSLQIQDINVARKQNR